MKFLSFLLGSCLMLCSSFHPPHPPKPGKPNVVIFFIDDLGWKDLSCYGSTYHETPAIDKLASRGVRFTNAYSACTVCSPSRAALMTGKAPARLHLTDWITGYNRPWAKLKIPDWRQYLPLEEETLAESLKKQGYTTWNVGKWHLGETENYWPENQGFDVNIAGNFKGAPNKNEAQGTNGYFSPYGLARITDGPQGEYLTDRLTQDALALIDKQPKEKPFFLYLAHYAVHTPIQGKPEKVARYQQKKDPSGIQKNAEYAAMMESMDESIGQVMQKLEEKGVLENTLVVFASDNGALLSVSPSTPLRKGKGWAYEGGVRTPLLLYWKGKLEGGKTIDEPAITMDIHATILEAVGIKAPKIADGKSLMPVVLKQKAYNRPLYWHYPHYHAGKPHSAVRLGDWKLIEFLEDTSYELYNLKEDLSETTNLAQKNTAKFKELQTLLHAWRTQVKAQMPTPNPDYDPAKADKNAAYAGKE